MEYPEIIKTIETQGEFSFKEKGSTFTGRVYPSASSEESLEIIAANKKEHYNATHVCSAYTHLNGDFKYSDDGEPNGTAGIRIYNAIQHFELTNVCVVVIRYFGGVKLGVGPLGKAYYNGAYGVLNESEIISLVNYSRCRIEYDYEFVSHIHHFLGQNECKITDNLFTTKPAIDFMILPGRLPDLQKQLTEVSRGQLQVEILEENIYI